MKVEEQIGEYINGLPAQKAGDMEVLHGRIGQLQPGCKLWFFDGRNEEGKVVSNPTIGYGMHTIEYADGTTKDTFRIGLSGNKTGISVYILGIEDKKYLAETFAKDIGKASVTGYCIKFKGLKDINIKVLEAAIRYGFAS